MKLLIEAMIQVFVFTLIPVVTYLIRKRTLKGFLINLGFKSMPLKHNVLPLIIGFLIVAVIGFLQVEYINSLSFKETTGLVTQQASQYTFNLKGILFVLTVACIKTALAEEIFFRGFLFNSMIPIVGFLAANIIQSVLFAAIHFPIITVFGLKSGLIIMTGPFIVAMLMGYLNHSVYNGSIFPSYILHALGNVISFGSKLF